MALSSPLVVIPIENIVKLNIQCYFVQFFVNYSAGMSISPAHGLRSFRLSLQHILYFHIIFL